LGFLWVPSGFLWVSFGFFRPSTSFAVALVFLTNSVVFRDLGICPAVFPPVFGLGEEVFQYDFDIVMRNLNTPGNPVGIQWDLRLFRVVEIEQPSVAEILVIGQMPCLDGVVVDMELVEVH
jgi:hypothetical protein